MTFEFSALRSATNNFNPANKLGEGQFGLVYKGVLNDGEEVVVKRLARNSREGIENSKKEVTILGKLRHPNLVKLLGFCVREEEMLLCYEYIPNRSLDQLLFGNLENQDSPLNWGMRYSILEGISAGLLYLHEDSGHAIIHREIKPSNILLDQNMVPKISDFGLSQLFDQDNFFVKLCRVASCGHMAPELQKKIISTNADVYSFGVLILEIVTGQRNSSFESGLVAHVLQCWSEGKVRELIDPKLKKPYPVNEIQRCIQIALACLIEEPRMRPKIRQVNHMLINKQAPLPKLPHNCSYWELVVSDSSRNLEDISLV
ncbi:cysteine-rich RECEPTOR-like kinase [Rhynchospora pubera]|nr:cysteine-rich RECEPTOR-like kinase [Rhynchospora pubera]